MNRCSSKEQSWLREHFSEESKSKAWRLNDEQHYTSPLKRRCLVGSRDSSGISFVDFNIKKLLDEKLPHLTFTRYQNEVRTFYASMCNEALEDGILTVEEAKMMGELSETLKLDPFQARQIMNQEALRVQKDFVNQNLASFYELAMSDGNLHREEARFIVEMKTKLEGEVVENVSQMIQHMDENGIRLKMEDELFFIELCRLALKDQRLDECEMDLLKSFVEKKGWEESKLLELLEQAKLS
jgi:hypothetical protein